MSNQNQNKKKPQTQNKEDLQQDKLQALVLLDSYSNKFEPLSSHRAECLLPFVGGRTLLDNNIEFLIDNGVEEIYLFCTKHYHQIKEYLEEKKPIWSRQVEIHFLYNFKCQSLGDAMRDIDAKGLIRSNFILITATSIISNLKLKDHLEQHKQTSKADKNAVMTMLCSSRLTDLSYTNSLKDSGVHDYDNTLVVHNNNKCILHYEQFAPGMRKKKLKQINIPYTAVENGYEKAKQTGNPAVENANAKYKLQSNQTNTSAISGIQGGSLDNILHLKTIQQRNDLLESQIYLCSPYVLHFFTDNFDFDTMSSFIKGVLIDEEVSFHTIYIDMFKLKFGSHFSLINNINSYYYETMRILQRPDLVLDYKAMATYRRLLDRVNVYLSKKSTKFGDNIKLDKNVFIDDNCKIGENCELVNCFVGANCIIGNNVKLSNSIIWPNSRIGNDCILNALLMANHVRIGNGCTFIENTLFSYECHVKDKTNLNERGIYVKREASKDQTKQCAESDKLNDNADFAKHLQVKEDNYTKYFSIKKDYLASNEEDDDDDEFEPIEGDENRMQSDDEDSNDDSISSEAKNFADTSKNRHFYVWKLQPKKNSNHLAKNSRQTDKDSDDDFDNESSDYSSSESETESEEGEYLEYSGSDDDFSGKKTGVKSKVRAHQEDTDIFYNEVIDILERGIKQNLHPDNIILEINSSKHANNIQIEDVSYFVAKAVFQLPVEIFKKAKKAQTDPSNSVQIDYFGMIKTQLKNNFALLQNYHTKSRQSQKIFLDSMQDFFIESELNANYSTQTGFLDAYYVKLFHYLYNECEDFLNEDLILEWYNKQKQLLDDKKDEAKSNFLLQNIEKRRHAINKLEPFINWLQESEEEDDDDE